MQLPVSPCFSVERNRKYIKIFCEHEQPLERLKPSTAQIWKNIVDKIVISLIFVMNRISKLSEKKKKQHTFEIDSWLLCLVYHCLSLTASNCYNFKKCPTCPYHYFRCSFNVYLHIRFFLPKKQLYYYLALRHNKN